MKTFVLVPGAWLGGWVWSRVITKLNERGHEAFPATLTGMGERVHLLAEDVGVETAIQDVLNVVEYNDLDDIVLAGHSFAGKVVAAVADRVPGKVSLLLYVDAYVPDKVRTPQAAFDPSSEFGPVPQGSLGVPLTEKTIDAIGKDVVGADREWLLSKATPWPLKLATDPVTLSSSFDSVKAARVFCRGGGDPVDDIIAGKWGKMEDPYKVIDSGHWPMITKPQELADDMISLAGSS